MLKDKSVFKTSNGNEAATKSFGMSVVTHKIQGEASFVAWSMDVKFEGENVPRHLDLMGHNEACQPTATPPWPFMDSMDRESGDDPCEDAKDEEEAACGGMTRAQQCADSNCQAAQKCKLVPYGGTGSPNCCPGPVGRLTGHHMIEDHWVQGLAAGFPMAQGSSGRNAAPTVCCEGSRFNMDHGEMHAAQGLIEEAHMQATATRPAGSMASSPWNYGEGKFATSTAHNMTFPSTTCTRECLEAQLDNFYGEDNSRMLQPPTPQSVAVNDTRNDGRWLRNEATEVITTLSSGG
jgi:hypothetical protein